MRYLKIMMMALMMCFVNTSISQEKYGTYEQSFFSEKSVLDVSISGDSTKFNVWVDVTSLDSRSQNGGVKLDNKSIGGFINQLNDAKVKYIEWVAVAKENKVTELDKSMNFTSKVVGFFSYGDWQFDYSVTLTCRFKVIGDKYLLIVETGEMVSSSNQFMKTDGVAFVFSNTNEIDNLMTLLSDSEIKKYFRTPKQKDLFKD